MTTPLVLTNAEVTRFWAKVQVSGPDECWPWTAGRFSSGYGAFKIRATRNNVPAHRVMCSLVHGVEPEVVMHRCDNPPCVNPAHLIPGTPRLNALDRSAKGRSASGETHGCSKLTDAQVLEIVALIQAGVSNPEIARRFGVGRNLPLEIERGHSWLHITGGPVTRPAVEFTCGTCGCVCIAPPSRPYKRFCSPSCYMAHWRHTRRTFAAPIKRPSGACDALGPIPEDTRNEQHRNAT